MIGTTELLLILGAGILLFGARRIPEIGRSLGSSVREFKKGMRGDDEPGKTGTGTPPSDTKPT